MAIIQNKSTEIGDQLKIVTDVPLIGIVALLSFVDDTENEVVNKYFKKQFRYSIDGITYSDILDLTLPNIQGIQVSITDTFIVEYYYTRTGIDASGELIFSYFKC